MSSSSDHARAAIELGDLLVRAADGDGVAFSELYAATAPRAFGLAVRVVRDRSRAEEVTEESYLRIWRTAAEFDPQRGSCQSWIFTIVHRVAVQHVRSSRAQAPGGRPSTQPRQGDPTSASEEATSARDALARLSSPEREALELSYFDGHTHHEVASLLGLPIATATSRIRDGLLRLRASVGNADGPPVVV